MLRWFQLARRLSELEESMLKLTRIVESRDLDWEDMRARCKRLLDRTEKYSRPLIKSDPDNTAEATAEPEQASNGGGLLTPRQKAVQQQILHRRMRGL
jgi:hypothetical protein